MNYLKLPHLDSEASVFDICQAHQQLESDYNNGGWLQERPSNKRRNEATSCQLSRLGYSDNYRWVNICNPDPKDMNPDDDTVRSIYLINVLKWELPIDEEMKDFMSRYFTSDFLETFPHWNKQNDLHLA